MIAYSRNTVTKSLNHKLKRSKENQIIEKELASINNSVDVTIA